MKEKYFKKLSILLVTLELCQPMPAYAAGWAQENGNWVYYQEDGTLAKNTFAQSGSELFYLGEDGLMVCNQIVEHEEQGVKNLYYVGSSGYILKDVWVQQKGPGGIYECKMHYCTKDGTLYTNTIAEIDGKKYYFNPSGFVVLDAQFEYDGNEYVAAKDGVITLIGPSKATSKEAFEEELKVKETIPETTAHKALTDTSQEENMSLWQKILKLFGIES